MPELPDVETMRKYVEEHALEQQIGSLDLRSPSMLIDTSPKELTQSLVGHSFVSTFRHGKYLFVETEANEWLVLHFGMTGSLGYLAEDEGESTYARMVVGFRNDRKLLVNSQRKLGKIGMTDDPDTFTQEHHLGPDALALLDSFEEFRGALGHRGMTKSALMDQSKIAGLGNIYSDEVLFQAGVGPRAKLEELDDKSLKRVWHSMKHVLREAIKRNADSRSFPDSWLTRHRGKGEECPRGCGKVEAVKAGGRTSYYCPECQCNR